MKYKPTRKGHSIPRALLDGLLVGWGVTLLLAGVITILLDTQTIGEKHLAPAAVLNMIVATTAGAFTATKRAKSARLVVSLASGALYFLSLLGCNAGFFGASFEGVVPSLFCTLGGSIAIGLLEIRQKGEFVKHRKRLYKS